MPTATRTVRSLKVACPLCGARDEPLVIDLNALTSIRCESCSEEFTPSQAVALAATALARWEGIARWIDSAPTD